MARPKKDAGDNPAEVTASEGQAPEQGTASQDATPADSTPAQEAPATPSKPPTDGTVTIANPQMAGKVVVAVTGNAVVFDKDGKATADAKDAKYLAGFTGYIVTITR